ncbi:MAG TPA: UDP-N-acetylglucosamine 2-epimerase (non-hydrolyzing) [Bacteroidales bacterium]|nr:UDP-N-acetylglucosamine 2-epimerase (non-hydrolyzing) [Bacteroidales bacterium]
MQNKKLLNIVGARPQIIKASAISRVLRKDYINSVDEIILHTGQHYDRTLSEVFFEELEIPKPDYNLGVGSARHGKQTASMITGIEEVILKEQPDAVIIYGDTNSTLAAGIAASKLKIPVAHIEAGLRSFRKEMPEEINRLLSDHISTLLFAPTDAALKNLIKEGIRPDASPPFTIDNPKIFLSGDIMYDNSLFFADLAEKKINGFLKKLNAEPGNYILATIHRQKNTDIIERLETILQSLIELSVEHNILLVLPLHPRTVHVLEKENPELLNRLRKASSVKLLPPVTYLEMILLEKNAAIICTDSGGVQKEAHFFRRPCLVLRSETEWIELVKNGTALLVDAEKDRIKEGYINMMNVRGLSYPGFYGNGKAAEFMVEEVMALMLQ